MSLSLQKYLIIIYKNIFKTIIAKKKYIKSTNDVNRVSYNNSIIFLLCR